MKTILFRASPVFSSLSQRQSQLRAESTARVYQMCIKADQLSVQYRKERGKHDPFTCPLHFWWDTQKKLSKKDASLWLCDTEGKGHVLKMKNCSYCILHQMKTSISTIYCTLCVWLLSYRSVWAVQQSLLDPFVTSATSPGMLVSVMYLSPQKEACSGTRCHLCFVLQLKLKLKLPHLPIIPWVFCGHEGLPAGSGVEWRKEEDKGRGRRQGSRLALTKSWEEEDLRMAVGSRAAGLWAEQGPTQWPCSGVGAGSSTWRARRWPQGSWSAPAPPAPAAGWGLTDQWWWGGGSLRDTNTTGPWAAEHKELIWNTDVRSPLFHRFFTYLLD